MSDSGEPDDRRSPFDRSACPFCGTSLDEAGVGFFEHLRTNPNCRLSFARWRGRSADEE